MTLQNLVGVSLDTVIPSRQTIQRLLDGAARNIADRPSERRKCRDTIQQCIHGDFECSPTLSCMLTDIETLTSRPGHHQTAIQALQLTLGLEQRVLVRLDALRKQGNATEYSGDMIPETAVAECLVRAEGLQAIAITWLKSNRPELL